MSDESPRAVLRSVNDEDRMSLHPGTVIGGAYVVDRLLGVGGMGTVVAARTIETGELVAIKFMLPQFAQHQQLLVRFQREARATERVQSRHVRRVIYDGAISARTPYIVMEYLDGEDLRSLIKREGPLEPRQAATYVAQACTGLAEAHALGIVHRDMKPANLFLARRPDGPSIIKVLDFGVAKFDSPNVSGDTLEVTEIAALVGSRYYMAPEQITNPQGVNVLADVWALGAILHYLLTGATPFGAMTAEEVLVNVLREPPHSLTELRPDIPAGLVAIVTRCLEKKREARYANVTEVARALLPFMRAHDEEPVNSARFPKDLFRTGRWTLPPIALTAPTTPITPIAPKAEPTPEPICESTTTPAKAASVVAEMRTDPEAETEPGHRSAIVSASTLPPPPTKKIVTLAPPAEREAAGTPRPASGPPTWLVGRPGGHPRAVVAGWIASAILGGLIAVAVGRPPPVLATPAVASALPALDRTVVTSTLVASGAPIEEGREKTAPAHPIEARPEAAPTPAKQAPAPTPAVRSPRPRAPAPAAAATASAAPGISRTPLFELPAANGAASPGSSR